MKIGEKIRFLRIQEGLTQEELGKIINIGQRTISAYESGKATPSVEVLKALADCFNVTVDYFLSDKPGKSEIEFIAVKFKTVPLYSAPVSAGNGIFPNEIYVIGEVKAISDNVDYAVKVVGDSMEPVAPEGAILFVKKQGTLLTGI